MDFQRGYAISIGASRYVNVNDEGVGTELMNNLLSSKSHHPWSISGRMMGETIPKATNFVALDEAQTDEWGIPQLQINIDYDDNDEKMLKDFQEQLSEMFEKAGCTQIEVTDTKQAPGLDIHEMGGVRMGRDSKTSLLNKWNQFHNCNNVFVTDGACMTSFSSQNPSLTFMMLTARAANYAIKEMKKEKI